MGQECSTDTTAQSYDLNQRNGIKIVGNGSNINNKSNASQLRGSSIIKSNKNPASRFKKSNLGKNSRLNYLIQKINTQLGEFSPSNKSVHPKGIRCQDSYVLNQQGLVYCQNGQWLNNMPNGLGQLIYPDGSYYRGPFVNGIPHGQGRFISIDNWYYQGDLYNQQAEGIGKFVSLKFGLEYQGKWTGDLPNGLGKQLWKQRSIQATYQGSFLNGNKHGQAKYTHPDFFYSGRFQNNQISGTGKIIYKNGQTYEGEFLNGKKHGHGLYTWPDRSKFQGQYQDDQKHGHGKFTNPDNIIFDGEWANGKRQGQGTVISDSKQFIYDWKKDKASPQKVISGQIRSSSQIRQKTSNH